MTQNITMRGQFKAAVRALAQDADLPEGNTRTESVYIYDIPCVICRRGNRVNVMPFGQIDRLYEIAKALDEWRIFHIVMHTQVVALWEE